MVLRHGVAGFAVGPDASYPVSATPQPGSWSAAGYPRHGRPRRRGRRLLLALLLALGSRGGRVGGDAGACVRGRAAPAGVGPASGRDRTMLWADTISCARSRQPSLTLAAPAGREPVSCGLAAVSGDIGR